MDKVKILIVDDHALLRDGIRALLGVYDEIKIVGEASEGKEAIEKTRELTPDVELMDWRQHAVFERASQQRRS